ncbi:hypothetical protein F0562_004619 [Nyssa sinensis]|uniref:Uncharacterized protein n=1 Tax=Nyssa sinensis TaxID=561372 RepID=A0A5J5C1V8_9ASTE|nr:hypothetical protein F0562_004619 [Nyssa sinensis]
MMQRNRSLHESISTTTQVVTVWSMTPFQLVVGAGLEDAEIFSCYKYPSRRLEPSSSSSLIHFSAVGSVEKEGTSENRGISRNHFYRSWTSLFDLRFRSDLVRVLES